MGGINDYFKSFKGEDATVSALLPSYETIISESLKVRISEERLEQLRKQYKSENLGRKKERVKPTKLKKVA